MGWYGRHEGYEEREGRGEGGKGRSLGGGEVGSRWEWLGGEGEKGEDEWGWNEGRARWREEQGSERRTHSALNSEERRRLG